MMAASLSFMFSQISSLARLRLLPLRKLLLYDLLHLVELGGGVADRLEENLPVASDDVAARDAAVAEESEDLALRVGGHREGVAVLTSEGLDLFGGLLARDGDHAEVGRRFVLAPDLPFEPRHLDAARRAPGGPEVDEHDLALQVFDLRLLAVERCEGERGHGLARLRVRLYLVARPPGRLGPGGLRPKAEQQ